MLLKNYLKQFFNNQRLLYKIKHRTTTIRYYHDTIHEEVPAFSLAQTRRTLKSFNVSFLEGHTCLITNCPICLDDTRKHNKIYINKTTGLYVCEHCHHQGSWNTLERFLQPKKSSKILQELSILRKSLVKMKNFKIEWEELKTTCKSINQLSSDEYQLMLETLSLPNIHQEIMSQMNPIYNSSTKTLYFPLIAFNELIVGYRSISSNFSSNTVPAMNAGGVIVYKQKNVKLDSSTVLVPSIEDLLALVHEKAANLITCLPYGLQHLPQQVLPSLEPYEKFILWFGNDEFSWDSARHFAKKLNEQRCLFVRPTDIQPRPKIAADLEYNLKSIVENAHPIWHQSITTFASLRQDVLSDVQNVDKVQGIKWTRYPALNKILKGHRRGEFTILTGPTGCGKTTFMSEYSLDLAIQGVNTLWGSFEIRNVRLAKTMLQQMVGSPLEDNVSNFDSFADVFEKLPIYFMTFHGQQNIKLVMEAIEHATYVHDIAHVIIDNVQFMMGTSDDSKFVDRFWKQDKIIACFRTFATKYNCHVTLVIHPRKERDEADLTTSSIFGGAKASQEADNVLIIQDKRLTSIRGKKFLQVAKNRFSGDLGIMTMDFDKDSLSYFQKKKAKSDPKPSNKDEINFEIDYTK